MDHHFNKNWCISKYYKDITSTINHLISETCMKNNLKLRNGSNGVWVSGLIPLSLLCSMKACYSCSEIYQIVTVLSIGQFINAICDIIHREPIIQIGYLVSSTVTSLVLILLSQGVIVSLLLGVISSVAYHNVNQTLIKACPRSFTWGEASLVSQSLILYFHSFLVNLMYSFQKNTKSCDDVATKILQTGFFALQFTLVLTYKLPRVMSYIVVFFSTVCVTFLVFAVLVPYACFNLNSITWIFQLITAKNSIILITFWGICCFAAVFFLYLQTKYSQPANTVTRKSFHLLIFFVILSGLITNSCLTYLSTGIGFALLVFIEMCRKLNFSAALQECFEMFKDEKDEGDLALTPLYLMVGCASPIWIFPQKFCLPVPPPVLGGIFPVAIGDAAASVGGMRFGTHKWNGTNKTKEGSAFCFVSQVLMYLLMGFLGIVEMRYFLWSSFVFAIISVIEAKTDQIDNLVLPFLTYFLLILVL